MMKELKGFVRPGECLVGMYWCNWHSRYEKGACHWHEGESNKCVCGKEKWEKEL